MVFCIVIMKVPLHGRQSQQHDQIHLKLNLFFSKPLERESIYADHSQERDSRLLPPSPILPVSVPPQSPVALRTTSTPALKPSRDSCHGGVSQRKRRRLAASPGGLHWNASGMAVINQAYTFCNISLPVRINSEFDHLTYLCPAHKCVSFL